MDLVTVVIPNLNGRHLLEGCLTSLGAQGDPDFAVVVVDNGSTDGSVEWLRAYHPQVRVLANPVNTGFAAAVNQGIRTTETEFVATLNNDTRVDEVWLSALVRALRRNPAAGMAASCMLFAHAPEVVNSTGVCIDRVGIAWDCNGGERLLDARPSPSPFGPSAGAALYRRSMLDDVGLFDEGFFAYLEDVDLAWRARWAGWGCVYVPEAVVYHAHSATSREGSSFKDRLKGRNKLWMVAKNYPFPHLLWYGLPILLYDLAAMAFAALTDRNLGPLYGRLEALKGLGRALAQRRERVQRVGATEVMRALRPAVAPWKVPRRYAHLSELGRGEWSRRGSCIS
jgi:hypothetical protein